MDPVTHTLTGAAIARAGLARATPLATATLIIAANIPDLDVIAYAWGPEFALTFRRGWTHGVLALAVWPFAVTGLILLWDRWVRRARGAAPVRGRTILAVATVGVLTHPLLDWLNVYGMRWLMPFSDRWFYGDALFIVDPLVWVVLVAGIRLAGPDRPRAARVALVLFALYAGGMLAVSARARLAVARALTSVGPAPSRVLAGPEPLMPLRRWMVAEVDGVYRVGRVAGPWTSPAVGVMAAIRPDADDPAARAAAATVAGRRFLTWARFPFYDVRPDTVVILDARYALDDNARFGIVKIALPSPGSGVRP